MTNRSCMQTQTIDNGDTAHSVNNSSPAGYPFYLKKKNHYVQQTDCDKFSHIKYTHQPSEHRLWLTNHLFYEEIRLTTELI